MGSLDEFLTGLLAYSKSSLQKGWGFDFVEVVSSTQGFTHGQRCAVQAIGVVLRIGHGCCVDCLQPLLETCSPHWWG